MKYTVRNITSENPMTRTKPIHIMKRGRIVALAPGQTIVIGDWDVNRILDTIATKTTDVKQWDRFCLALVKEYGQKPVIVDEDICGYEQHNITELFMDESNDKEKEELLAEAEPAIEDQPIIEDEVTVDNEEAEDASVNNDIDVLNIDEEKENDIDYEGALYIRTRKEMMEWLHENGYSDIASTKKTLKSMKEELSNLLGK